MLSVIGTILSFIISLFMILLTVRVFISWLSLPYSNWIYYIEKITNPPVNFFRRHLPVRIGVFDISIVFLFASLAIVQMLINDVMVAGLPITFGYLLSFIVYLVKMVVSFVFFSLILGTIILLVISYTSGAIHHPVVSAFKSIIDPFVMTMAKIFKLRKLNAAKIYLIILLVVLIIAGFVVDNLLMLLYNIVKLF